MKITGDGNCVVLKFGGDRGNYNSYYLSPEEAETAAMEMIVVSKSIEAERRARGERK
jgi:hypothetical protein